jgi:dolichol kinase
MATSSKSFAAGKATTIYSTAATDMDVLFWVNQASKLALFYLIAYLGGLLVEQRGVRVNYTRKINHFALFFLPAILDPIIPFEETPAAVLVFSLIGMLSLVVFIKPLRRNVPIIRRMFRSFDRPEDRPHTMAWLVTQFIGTFIVLIPFAVYFSNRNLMELIYIPILINGIGDGLAEPVGIRYGKNHYEVGALFTDRRYTRTLEGSACVLITSIVVVIAYSAYFSQPQFLVALLLVPILMTLAEAFSPHTWDSPFLMLVGGLVLVLILNFV